MREFEVGPKQRPDFTRRLWRIFDYVRDRTGHYHDRYVTLVLQEAKLRLGPADEITEESLRKWRAQHPHP